MRAANVGSVMHGAPYMTYQIGAAALFFASVKVYTC
jgi:hypothetical protein